MAVLRDKIGRYASPAADLSQSQADSAARKLDKGRSETGQPYTPKTYLGELQDLFHRQGSRFSVSLHPNEPNVYHISYTGGGEQRTIRVEKWDDAVVADGYYVYGKKTLGGRTFSATEMLADILEKSAKSAELRPAEHMSVFEHSMQSRLSKEGAWAGHRKPTQPGVIAKAAATFISDIHTTAHQLATGAQVLLNQHASKKNITEPSFLRRIPGYVVGDDERVSIPTREGKIPSHLRLTTSDITADILDTDLVTSRVLPQEGTSAFRGLPARVLITTALSGAGQGTVRGELAEKKLGVYNKTRWEIPAPELMLGFDASLTAEEVLAQDQQGGWINPQDPKEVPLGGIVGDLIRFAKRDDPRGVFYGREGRVGVKMGDWPAARTEDVLVGLPGHVLQSTLGQALRKSAKSNWTFQESDNPFVEVGVERYGTVGERTSQVKTIDLKATIGVRPSYAASFATSAPLIFSTEAVKGAGAFQAMILDEALRQMASTQPWSRSEEAQFRGIEGGAEAMIADAKGLLRNTTDPAEIKRIKSDLNAAYKLRGRLRSYLKERVQDTAGIEKQLGLKRDREGNIRFDKHFIEEVAPGVTRFERAWSTIFDPEADVSGLGLSERQIAQIARFRKETGYGLHYKEALDFRPLAFQGKFGINEPRALAYIPRVEENGKLNREQTLLLLAKAAGGANPEQLTMLADQLEQLYQWKSELPGGEIPNLFEEVLGGDPSRFRITPSGNIDIKPAREASFEGPALVGIRPGYSVSSQEVSAQFLNFLEQTAGKEEVDALVDRALKEGVSTQSYWQTYMSVEKDQALSGPIVNIDDLPLAALDAAARKYAVGKREPTTKDRLQGLSYLVRQAAGTSRAMLRARGGGYVESPAAMLHHETSDPVTGESNSGLSTSYLSLVEAHAGGNVAESEGTIFAAMADYRTRQRRFLFDKEGMLHKEIRKKMFSFSGGGKIGGGMQYDPRLDFGEVMLGGKMLHSAWSKLRHAGMETRTFKEFEEWVNTGDAFYDATRFPTTQGLQVTPLRIMSAQRMFNEGRISLGDHDALKRSNAIYVSPTFAVQTTGDYDMDFILGLMSGTVRREKGGVKYLETLPSTREAWEKGRAEWAGAWLRGGADPGLYYSVKALLDERSEATQDWKKMVAQRGMAGLKKVLMGTRSETTMAKIIRRFAGQQTAVGFRGSHYGLSVDFPAAMQQSGKWDDLLNREEQLRVVAGLGGIHQEAIDSSGELPTWDALIKASNFTLGKRGDLLAILKGPSQILQDGQFEEGKDWETKNLVQYLPEALALTQHRLGKNTDLMELLLRQKGGDPKELQKALAMAAGEWKNEDSGLIASTAAIAKAIGIGGEDFKWSSWFDKSALGRLLIARRAMPLFDTATKKGIEMSPDLLSVVHDNSDWSVGVPGARGAIPDKFKYIGPENALEFWANRVAKPSLRGLWRFISGGAKAKARPIDLDLEELVKGRQSFLDARFAKEPDVWGSRPDNMPANVVRASMLGRPLSDVALESMMSWDWRQQFTEENLLQSGVQRKQIEQLRGIYGEDVIVNDKMMDALVYGKAYHAGVARYLEPIREKYPELLSVEQPAFSPSLGLSGQLDQAWNLEKMRELQAAGAFEGDDEAAKRMRFILSNKSFAAQLANPEILALVPDVKTTQSASLDEEAKQTKMRQSISQLVAYRELLSRALGVSKKRIGVGVSFNPTHMEKYFPPEVEKTLKETTARVRRENPNMKDDLMIDEIVNQVEAVHPNFIQASGEAAFGQGALGFYHPDQLDSWHTRIFGGTEGGRSFLGQLGIVGAARSVLTSFVGGQRFTPERWDATPPAERASVVRELVSHLLRQDVSGTYLATLRTAREAQPQPEKASSSWVRTDRLAATGVEASAPVPITAPEQAVHDNAIRQVQNMGAAQVSLGAGPGGAPEVRFHSTGVTRLDEFVRAILTGQSENKRIYAAERRSEELLSRYTPGGLAVSNEQYGRVMQSLPTYFEKLAKEGERLKNVLNPTSEEFAHLSKRLDEGKRIYQTFQKSIGEGLEATNALIADRKKRITDVQNQIASGALEGKEKKLEKASALSHKAYMEGEVAALEALKKGKSGSFEDLAAKMASVLPAFQEMETASEVMDARKAMYKPGWWQRAAANRDRVSTMWGGGLGALGFGMFNLSRAYNWTIGRFGKMGEEYTAHQQSLAQARFEAGAGLELTPEMAELRQQAAIPAWLKQRFGRVYMEKYAPKLTDALGGIGGMSDRTVTNLEGAALGLGALTTWQIGATTLAQLTGFNWLKYAGPFQAVGALPSAISKISGKVGGLFGGLGSLGGVAGSAGAGALGVAASGASLATIASVAAPILAGVALYGSAKWASNLPDNEKRILQAYGEGVPARGEGTWLQRKILSEMTEREFKAAGITSAYGTFYKDGRVASTAEVEGARERARLQLQEKAESLKATEERQSHFTEMEKLAGKMGLLPEEYASLEVEFASRAGRKLTEKDLERFAPAVAAAGGSAALLAKAWDTMEKTGGYIRGTTAYNQMMETVGAMTSTQQGQLIAGTEVLGNVPQLMGWTPEYTTEVAQGYASKLATGANFYSLAQGVQQQYGLSPVQKALGIPVGPGGGTSAILPYLAGKTPLEEQRLAEALQTTTATAERLGYETLGQSMGLADLFVGITQPKDKPVGISGFMRMLGKLPGAALRGILAQEGAGISLDIGIRDINVGKKIDAYHESIFKDPRKYRVFEAALSAYRSKFPSLSEDKVFEYAKRAAEQGLSINQLGEAINYADAIGLPSMGAEARIAEGSRIAGLPITGQQKSMVAEMIAGTSAQSWSLAAYPGFAQYLPTGDPRRGKGFQPLVDIVGNKWNLYNSWTGPNGQKLRPQWQYNLAMENLGLDLNVAQGAYSIYQSQWQIHNIQREFGSTSFAQTQALYAQRAKMTSELQGRGMEAKEIAAEVDKNLPLNGVGLAQQEYMIRRQMWRDSVASQQASIQLQREMLGLAVQEYRERRQYQLEERNANRAMELRQRGWQMADMRRQQGRFEVQTGWQMEDFERNIRFASGRERIDMMRQRDRFLVTTGWQRDDQSRERRHQQELWRFQDARYQKGVDFEKRMNEFQERRFALQGRALDIQEDSLNRQIANQEALQKIEDVRFADEVKQQQGSIGYLARIAALEKERQDLMQDWVDELKLANITEQSLIQSWIKWMQDNYPPGAKPPTGGKEGPEGPGEQEGTGGKVGGKVKRVYPRPPKPDTGVKETEQPLGDDGIGGLTVNLYLGDKLVGTFVRNLHRNMHEIDARL